MKTPISYYGGKQTMLKHILPLIPNHTIYTEAFCGGCAVMFANEIIKDYAQRNGLVINRVQRTIFASKTEDGRRKQEEWMVCNYEAPQKELGLF